MPTLHVKPDGALHLQTIADTLWKARKVVVITGAGISTNSGIPDFRSENGLYSLIQAQYDSARNANGLGDPSRDANDDKGRSAKRPRLSADLDCTPAEPRDLSRLPAVEAGSSCSQNHPLPVTASAPPPPPAASSTLDETETCPPSASPRLKPRAPRGHRISHHVSVPGSLQPPSSPLSSPPLVLFDPFSDDTYEDSSSTTPSESGDPLACPSFSSSLSSHPTVANTRSSLPNMKGKDLFDASIWSDPVRTSVFYRFTTSLKRKSKASKPTKTHHFIGQLRDKGKLVRCYTQNIDEIEKRVGLSTCLELGPGSRARFSRPSRTSAPATLARSASDPGVLDMNTAPPPQISGGVECVFLHGSLDSLRCFQCGQTSAWEYNRELETLSGNQPACPHCEGATAARQNRGKRALGVGKLRPDIVLYGEEHPNAHLISPLIRHDLSLNPDMLLILGTSLRVHGLKVIVREFAKSVHKRGGIVVFVNLTRPSESVWSDILDYWVDWDCDAWVDDLGRREAEPKNGKTSSARPERSTGKKKNHQKVTPEDQNPQNYATKQKPSPLAHEAPEDMGGQNGDEKDVARPHDDHKDSPTSTSEAARGQDSKDLGCAIAATTNKPRTMKRKPRRRTPELPEATKDDAYVWARLHAALALVGGRPNNYLRSILRPLDPSSSDKVVIGDYAYPPRVPEAKASKPKRPSCSSLRPQKRKPPQSLLQIKPPAIATPMPLAATPKGPDEPLRSPSAITSTSLAEGVAAAIKTNPRKRKPKIIDGVSIVAAPTGRQLKPVFTKSPFQQVTSKSAIEAQGGAGSNDERQRSMPSSLPADSAGIVSAACEAHVPQDILLTPPSPLLPPGARNVAVPQAVARQDLPHSEFRLAPIKLEDQARNSSQCTWSNVRLPVPSPIEPKAQHHAAASSRQRPLAVPWTTGPAPPRWLTDSMPQSLPYVHTPTFRNHFGLTQPLLRHSVTPRTFPPSQFYSGPPRSTSPATARRTAELEAEVAATLSTMAGGR